MKLEQFKEIADENLQDLIVDERMLQKVHQKIYAQPVRSRPAFPRRAFTLAAACIAVMLISGGVLAGTTGVGKIDAVKHKSATTVYQQPVNSASTLSAHTRTSEYIDGTMLSYGIEEIGEYCDGFAAALATNGLYGIVNESKVWVVKALYDEVLIEQNGNAVVTLQGTEQKIEISAE